MLFFIIFRVIFSFSMQIGSKNSFVRNTVVIDKVKIVILPSYICFNFINCFIIFYLFFIGEFNASLLLLSYKLFTLQISLFPLVFLVERKYSAHFIIKLIKVYIFSFTKVFFLSFSLLFFNFLSLLLIKVKFLDFVTHSLRAFKTAPVTFVGRFLLLLLLLLLYFPCFFTFLTVWLWFL